MKKGTIQAKKQQAKNEATFPDLSGQPPLMVLPDASLSRPTAPLPEQERSSLKKDGMTSLHPPSM